MNKPGLYTLADVHWWDQGWTGLVTERDLATFILMHEDVEWVEIENVDTGWIRVTIKGGDVEQIQAEYEPYRLVYLVAEFVEYDRATHPPAS